MLQENVMKIYKRIIDDKPEIIVEDRNKQFVMGWWCNDVYWIMTNYTPGASFTLKEADEPIFSFLIKMFRTEHFSNNTFTWLSEARAPEESSSLKITKGKDYFRIRFIQGEGDFLAKARNICPICFCLSGSRKQEIANNFSLLLQELINRG